MTSVLSKRATCEEKKLLNKGGPSLSKKYILSLLAPLKSTKRNSGNQGSKWQNSHEAPNLSVEEREEGVHATNNPMIVLPIVSLVILLYVQDVYILQASSS